MTMTLEAPWRLGQTATDEFGDPVSYWYTITPDDARTMLDANDNNRGLRSRLVTSYARDMEAGNWMVTGETIKFDRAGALMDGQHRLESIVASGKPQRMLIVEGLEPAARGVIDTGAIRTGGDALRLAGVDSSNPEALAAAARLLVLWQSGRLRVMGSGMRKDDRATHQEIIDMVTREPDLLDAVKDATRDYPRIGIPVGPQAMCRVVLHRIAAEDAGVFWDALSGYATDGANDPRAVLLYTVQQMRALGQLRKPGESVGLVFSAWNAWRDGQKIRHLNTRDTKDRPLPIPEPL